MKPVEPVGEIQIPNNYQVVEDVVTEEKTSSLIQHSSLVQPNVLSALAEQEVAS